MSGEDVRVSLLAPAGELSMVRREDKDIIVANPADESLARWLASDTTLTFTEWEAGLDH